MNNDKPRVSIGLPVFNGEKYLEQALDSILAQSYTDFELIISDNASTDRTQEICQAYVVKDQRIRYYRNEKNLGAPLNYMRTFALSLGGYFKWAAYDDIIAPTFLEKCVEVLDQKTDVILCYSKAMVIDEHGASVVDHDPEPDLTSLGPHQRFRQFMFTSYLNIQASGLMRADILKRTGGFGTYPAADEVMLAELSLYGQFYEIPERLFFVRLHPGQSTFGALMPGQNQKRFKQRDRILWFNTAYEGKIVLPHWLFFLDSLRAIRWAPLSRYERVYCYALMVRWILIPSHFRALGKDALLAAQKILVRSFSRLKTKSQLADVLERTSHLEKTQKSK